ncbi:MAG: hypothetical protein J0I57_22055 [Hyphomicrobium sp.]|nr:hypothetical protein [Hyphomicrobium sp.]MBN9280292.1 hypothetical protein [Hyphomicrobium sp.]
MNFALKAFAAAAMLASASTFAAAAPANMSHMPGGVSSDIIQVHGNHADCRRDRGGWHRHNRFGERRACRRWDGRGRRPGACVQVGPVWYCG